MREDTVKDWRMREDTVKDWRMREDALKGLEDERRHSERIGE